MQVFGLSRHVTRGAALASRQRVSPTSSVVAASVLASRLATVATGEVYVARATVVGTESAAAKAGLRSIEGGRLTLRPFPTARPDGSPRCAAVCASSRGPACMRTCAP